MAAVQLHKLNGDTSWLLRLPTMSSKSPSQDARYYNLVLDPWLDATPQIDGSPLFSRQTRTEPATFASIAQLDQWLHSQSQGSEKLDAIVFSHPFTDHLHPETITDANSIAVLQRVTILTTDDSFSALRSLHVDLDRSKVVNLSSVATRQDADQDGTLPVGISIQHLPARDWALSPAWTKLHGAILVSCRTAAHPVHIVYSPHGITPTSLPDTFKQARQELEKRILIHSFDRQALPLIGVVACGFPNVLGLLPTFKPDLVLATHDEHKRAEGIVGRLISRKSFSLQHAQQLLEEQYPQQAQRCLLKQLAPGESVHID
ncbi:hypothetical protein EX895_001840 [Sporisorium graminicola]|uniref:Metallo-beta-lactamase domain-containing protein n=1 Tax=Sporisorium graminicola TaxID=280036 RepID=A0A4V6EVX1_9BASI|nr:hypothetical protein EX895_001840 [Sporisorium graminicola]TKY89309.1 hypothetical protein EX895_001840 [Sporisorium graminicola]